MTVRFRLLEIKLSSQISLASLAQIETVNETLHKLNVVAYMLAGMN